MVYCIVSVCHTVRLDRSVQYIQYCISCTCSYYLTIHTHSTYCTSVFDLPDVFEVPRPILLTPISNIQTYWHRYNLVWYCIILISPDLFAPRIYRDHITMGASSVRRNIFHHHLSRRPVSTASSNASTQHTHSASGLSSHMLSSTASESTSSLSSGSVDNGEIVTRDKNGGYKLDIPILPPIAGRESEDEMEGVEAGGVSGGSGAGGADATGQADLSEREKESTLRAPVVPFTMAVLMLTAAVPKNLEIEATLVEMMCRSRNRQMSSEPAGMYYLNISRQSHTGRLEPRS